MRYHELGSLTVVQLDALLAKIEVRKAEEEWKATVKRLEIEAIDAVQALREMTGRNYQFLLGAVSMLPQRHVAVYVETTRCAL